MSQREHYDAVIVGSGPNGLAAAVTLAEHGWRVLVCEAAAHIGGGTRTAELTLPGFHHDVCSAIHPLAVASPFFQTRPLAEHGLEWCWAETELAHPLEGGSAVALYRDLDRTADELGPDAAAYRRLVGPLVKEAKALLGLVLAPGQLLAHVGSLARLAWAARRSAQGLAKRFRGERARALFAGAAGHAVMPLDQPLSAAAGLMLCVLGHAFGWPAARGGSHAITRALAGYLTSLGGTIVTDRRIQNLANLPASRVVLFDLNPAAVAALAGAALPQRYSHRLRCYRHGPAAFKLDWALAGPIPWQAAVVRTAGTVHVGGTFEEIAAAELAPWQGRAHPRPYLLVAQQSLMDPSRAPPGQHTGWAYCHVPNGATTDQTEAMEQQIERFAPGFRELILARSVMTPAAFEAYNANFVGGDVVGGAQDWVQLLARPMLRLNPYATPHPHLFLCSASTPPGGGVHGLSGYLAARAALRTAVRLPVVQWSAGQT